MPSPSLSSFYPVYFLFIEIFCGLAAIVLCEHLKRLLQHVLLDIEEEELSTIIYFIELNALHVITIFICGYFMSQKTMNEPYTPELSLTLRLWCFLSFQLALTAFLIGFVCVHTRHHLREIMLIVYEDSIQNYYFDSNWKMIWDELQYKEECCGVNGFLDWANVTRDVVVEIEPELIMKRSASVFGIPYSCCRKNAFCNDVEAGDVLDLALINQKGCYTKVAGGIERTLAQLIVIHFAVFLFEFVIIFLMRMMYLSRRKYLCAEEIGDLNSSFEE